MSKAHFARQLLAWSAVQGRKELPWQEKPTPYRVWVSEIMLQQTQVSTVIDYYLRFMQRFPDLTSLAHAHQDEVLSLWAGLGYYSRARNLHACAQQVLREYQGIFPLDDLAAMQKLPGIGPSTAAAIVALSSNRRAVILDGNVKRVVARYFAISGWPGQSAVNKQLWQLADQLTPADQAAAYTQAIMDLGATLCTPRQPACDACPVAEGCLAHKRQLTAQLPTPRPKKKLPEKKSLFLVLQQPQQKILLHKRPSSGIWGGLWCLPEFEDLISLRAWLAEHYPQACLAQQPDASFRHSFTHYHLHLQPWQAQIGATEAIAPDTQLWYNLQAATAEIGLPAPIQRLLTGLKK